MGQAIAEFHKKGHAVKLRVFSSMFYEDNIPVKTLFRNFANMPPLEQKMLGMAEGRVLDVGAGSGCHSLELMKMGREVVAIDISALSVEVMTDRGVDARQVDFFDETFAERFDTIIMAMNGIGIVGRVERLPEFFKRAKLLLNPGGRILLDLSDLKYVFENEDGSFDIDLAVGYYGEVDYAMKYRTVQGDSFDWLYLDFATLQMYANESGFKCEKVADGSHYDYLAMLTLQS